MPKFRNKLVVEAIQFTGGNSRAVMEFTGTKIQVGNSNGVFIKGVAGDGLARAGDWIVRDVDGQLHLYKPDIFEATYEPVESVLYDAPVAQDKPQEAAYFLGP